MKHDFFRLPLEKQSLLIRKAGDQFDIPDTIIEKDLWICWLLEKLFALPIKMAFKGGTSLSKAFDLIKRFSEDVDITIDYLNFIPKFNLKDINRTQLKRINNQLKEQLTIYISKTVLPYFQKQMMKILPKESFEVTLSDNGEQLRFYYSNMTNQQSHYLRDHILIEFGIRNNTEPCKKLSITPYLAHVVDNSIRLPSPIIDVLSPIRTFWEKATLIHVECHRHRLGKTPDRLSRHWYDLHMLNQSWVGQQALSQTDILKNVLEHKKAFFYASYAHYDDCLKKNFRLIPEKNHQMNLTRDFNRMITAGMFYEDSLPPFSDIIASLKDLEDTINGKSSLNKLKINQ